MLNVKCIDVIDGVDVRFSGFQVLRIEVLR